MCDNKTRHIRRFTAIACAVVLLSAQAAWAGVQPTPFRTGLFAVARGQGVRVSLVNAGDVRGIITPCVKIWDAQAQLLAETDVGRVRRGHSVSASYQPIPDDGTPGGAPISDDGRVLVRVEVELLTVAADGTRTPLVLEDRAALRHLLGSVIPSVEVFNLVTGKTAYTLPFARVAFNPQPEPPEPIHTR